VTGRDGVARSGVPRSGVPRTDVPMAGGERETLRAHLDGVDRRSGEEYSLRRILVHPVQQYARQNGHADLHPRGGRRRHRGVTGDEVGRWSCPAWRPAAS
jgi:hypothetical protein